MVSAMQCAQHTACDVCHLHLILQVIPTGSTSAYLQCDWQAQKAGKVSCNCCSHIQAAMLPITAACQPLCKRLYIQRISISVSQCMRHCHTVCSNVTCISMCVIHTDQHGLALLHVQMLFMSLETGKLEAYSLRLHSPSKFAVSANAVTPSSRSSQHAVSASLVTCTGQKSANAASKVAVGCKGHGCCNMVIGCVICEYVSSCSDMCHCHRHHCKHSDALAAKRLVTFWHRQRYKHCQAIAHALCCMQVSASGRYVATFFKHTVFVYSTERPAMQPLKLYHTKLITVSLSISPPFQLSMHCTHLKFCVTMAFTAAACSKQLFRGRFIRMVWISHMLL